MAAQIEPKRMSLENDYSMGSPFVYEENRKRHQLEQEGLPPDPMGGFNIDENLEAYENAALISTLDFSHLNVDDFGEVEYDDDGTPYGMVQGVPVAINTQPPAQTTPTAEAADPGYDKVGDDIKRGVLTGQRDAGRAFNETAATVVGAPVDLMNEGLQYLGLGSDYPIGGSDSIRDALASVVNFGSSLVPKEIEAQAENFAAQKPQSPLIQNIVNEITKFGINAVTPAVYLRAFTVATPFARGLAWGGIADFINAQPDDESAIAQITRELSGASPDERSAIENAVMTVLERNNTDPDFVNKARAALDGMVLGAAIEKGAEVLVSVVKSGVLQDAFENMVQEAKSGTLGMGVGPVSKGDKIAEMRRQGNIDRFGYDPNASADAPEVGGGFDAYRQRVDPDGRTIPAEDRPNLRMGDMYGMLPKNAEAVKELEDGVTLHRGANGDYYATAYNPDVGEQDVVGYIQGGDNGTELAVVEEMQGRGIGSELQYLFRSENPLAPTGGLTEAGARRLKVTYDRLAADRESMVRPPAVRAEAATSDYPKARQRMLPPDELSMTGAQRSELLEFARTGTNKEAPRKIVAAAESEGRLPDGVTSKDALDFYAGMEQRRMEREAMKSTGVDRLSYKTPGHAIRQQQGRVRARESAAQREITKNRNDTAVARIRDISGQELWSAKFKADVDKWTDSGDYLEWAKDAVSKANMEAVPRALLKEGWTMRHASKGKDKRASSRYLISPDKSFEVRLSDHELPDTPQRAYMQAERGTRWDDELVLRGDESPKDVINEIKELYRNLN